MGIVEELVEIWPNEVCDIGIITSSLIIVFSFVVSKQKS